MNELRFTFLTDGSSDRALMPLLKWLLDVNGVHCAIQAQWAELGRAPLPNKPTLTHKIHYALDLYPCDLLFVHRDAETESRAKRVDEIQRAVEFATKKRVVIPPYVCVIPVRMQETWLLFDEAAIKQAAGNRHYRDSLHLPSLQSLEDLSDPKDDLHQRLKQACQLHGRRLRDFPVQQHAQRVLEFVQDFSPLRVLSAFQALEKDIRAAIQQYNWHQISP